MIRPLTFLATVLALLGLCLMVATPRPRIDAFAALGPGRALALDDLAVEDLAQLKLRHLLDHPPYELLLLGNSRPLPLGGAELGVDPGRLFNLSLTGESFRASVMVLERLAEAGRLPRQALIAFDHAELNYYNNPLWPPALSRWRQVVEDIEAGLLRRSIPFPELARMVLRHLRSEGTLISHDLSFTRVMRGLRHRFAAVIGDDETLAPLAAGASGYLADGSRPTPPSSAPVRGDEPLTPPNRNVLPGYLDYDLERLAAIARQGTRIVVYETLLYPPLHRRAMAEPSLVATETRSRLETLCQHHRLECHTAPLEFDDHGKPWADVSHPPAAVLAEYVAGFLDPALRLARR